MQLTSGCFGRDKREDGGEGHWRLAREEGVRDKWMMWQQLNYFGSKFWELLEERVFFPPNNFWQGLKTSFLGLQFLDTLRDALSLSPIAYEEVMHLYLRGWERTIPYV